MRNPNTADCGVLRHIFHARADRESTMAVFRELTYPFERGVTSLGFNRAGLGDGYLFHVLGVRASYVDVLISKALIEDESRFDEILVTFAKRYNHKRLENGRAADRWILSHAPGSHVRKAAIAGSTDEDSVSIEVEGRRPALYPIATAAKEPIHSPEVCLWSAYRRFFPFLPADALKGERHKFEDREHVRRAQTRKTNVESQWDACEFLSQLAESHGWIKVYPTPGKCGNVEWMKREDVD